LGIAAMSITAAELGMTGFVDAQSSYLIGSQESGKMPLPPKAELEWWYQYYFATERGRAGHNPPLNA
jgi:hypothetical protein